MCKELDHAPSDKKISLSLGSLTRCSFERNQARSALFSCKEMNFIQEFGSGTSLPSQIGQLLLYLFRNTGKTCWISIVKFCNVTHLVHLHVIMPLCLYTEEHIRCVLLHEGTSQHQIAWGKVVVAQSTINILFDAP